MSSHEGLSEVEYRFVTDPPPGALARIATVDVDGLPHVVPGGWSWDSRDQVFVLGGREVPSTIRAAHVSRTGLAAITIDGVATDGPWAPWALVVRGRAAVDEVRRAIVLHPDRVTSWGL